MDCYHPTHRLILFVLEKHIRRGADAESTLEVMEGFPRGLLPIPVLRPPLTTHYMNKYLIYSIPCHLLLQRAKLNDSLLITQW